MRYVIAIANLAIGIMLLGFSAFASYHAPPVSFDSRDVFVVAIGACGVTLGLLGVRALRDERRKRHAGDGQPS